MTVQPHHPQSSLELKDLGFTLWRLQREHEERHRNAVNRQLNARPRERRGNVN